MAYDPQKLKRRILEIETELIRRDVKPEKVNLEKMSEANLIEYGKAIAEQLETRKKFLKEI